MDRFCVAREITFVPEDLGGIPASYRIVKSGVAFEHIAGA
jgi:hypothetical protein